MSAVQQQSASCNERLLGVSCKPPTTYTMLRHTFRVLVITELCDILHCTVTTQARIGRF
jgi:hypothetical protein